jgi:hypothetical protein
MTVAATVRVTIEQAMTQWEYKRVCVSDVLDDNLKQLGLEGWELVAINHHQEFWFKRPINNFAGPPINWEQSTA